MAYLAFYRMFRPDSFQSVVRQEHIIRILKNQISTGRIGHAYLFCGPRGTGKTTVARIFAKAINCENPVDGSPCGKCRTCKALSEPGNLDISEIDAASNNGVDEMRDLREKVQYPPVAGKYKVYVIDEVHMLTDSAFNALLKTLEEPPKHAVFIMATTEPHKIPATILSRCMRFDFKLLPLEDLENHLKGILKKIGKEYEEEAVAAIARAGAGSDRDMLSIADMCVSYSSGKLTYSDVTKVLGSADFYETGELCKAVLAGDSSSSITKLENIIAEGKGIGVLIKDVMSFLNSCAVAKMCRGADKILSLPEDMYSFVKGIADSADGHRLLRVTEIMAKAENDLKYSTSPRIIAETAFIKASMPETDYNIDSLIARINELESKIASGNFAANVKPVEEKEVKEEVNVKREKKPVISDEPPAYFGEEPVFDFSYSEEPIFDAEIITEKKPLKTQTTVNRAETGEIKPVIAPPPAPQNAGKANAFGRFLRALRKTNKNGVLFVMCQDLRSEYRGDTFVLYTDSEVVYKSLNRDAHAEAVKVALESIGITDYSIELRGGNDAKESLTDRIKADFGDVTIEER